ncbi:MAG: glyceraldehyde 3-phosphate dehydrogenase NAD-binding domain-containing protein [Candidatus Paceibacterota bacterium]
MKKTRVAINGFGRIGRAFFKVAEECKELEVVAINDLGDVNNLAYLLKYDTVYGKSDLEISVTTEGGKSYLKAGKAKALFLSEKDTTRLPWKELDIDVVVESTGLFAGFDKAKFHLDQGAKRVVISAPAKAAHDTNTRMGTNDTNGETVIMGVNEDKLKTCQISSNASCTTNAGAPLIAILDEAIGIEKAILNTVHGYTASQGIVDGPNKKDWREGRAAAQNIVPSTTGAAIATTLAYPALAGKFDGISVRVPVVAGSIVDITFIAKRATSVEEVNSALKAAAKTSRWEKTFAVTEEELVSRDILGDSHASIADLKFTRVVDGNLVKVMAWYDNEMGYTHTLVDHVVMVGKLIN